MPRWVEIAIAIIILLVMLAELVNVICFLCKPYMEKKRIKKEVEDNKRFLDMMSEYRDGGEE